MSKAKKKADCGCGIGPQDIHEHGKQTTQLPDPVKKYLAQIGKKGGSQTSERKKITAAENGRRGGAPKNHIK